MIFLFIIVPLAAAFLTALAGRYRPRLGSVIAVLTSSFLLGLAVLVLRLVVAGQGDALALSAAGLPVAGITLSADGMASFLLLVVHLVFVAVAFYSMSYMRRYTDTWKYYTLFMIMIAGVNGVIMTGDLFTMFVFLEIASIAVYALTAFGTEDEALEASFKYAVMSAVASSFIFIGIALVYGAVASLSLVDIGMRIAAGGPRTLFGFAAVLFLGGLGLKAALVPFHAWLPDVYAKAPAPVAALSSGVLLKVLGIYALWRLFFTVFGAPPAVMAALIVFGVLSIFVGSIMAFGQTNIRRLFGFSGISQIGFIALALGVGTPLAVTAAFFHLFSHSVAKSLLFLSSGEMENLFGTTDVRRMTGMAAKRPLAAYGAVLAAASLCGIPPFGGFWSKLFIIFACIQAGRTGLALLAVLASVLTVAYYARALTGVFFGKEGTASSSRKSDPGEMPVTAACAFGLLVAAVVFGGLIIGVLNALAPSM